MFIAPAAKPPKIKCLSPGGIVEVAGIDYLAIGKNTIATYI